MPRAVSVVRLVELMTEDVRIAAQISELQRKRAEARAAVVAELRRRDVTELSGLGKTIELMQQTRRHPSIEAARERLAAKGGGPELIAGVIVETVDTKALEQLRKARLIEEDDLDFIAPKRPHGDPYPVLKVQGGERGRPGGSGRGRPQA